MIHLPEDFQEKKQESLFAAGQGSLRQETSLLVPQRGVQAVDFAQNLLDDRGPVLFHIHTNIDAGPEVTLREIFFGGGAGFVPA